MRYRKDIDGLRSLAILPVVWYHAGLPGLPAGFAGVDVFFVISGFLITGILHNEYVRTGRISFGNFYQRRARRILPALFFSLVLTSVAGAFVLDTLDFADLQKQALSALFFVSNVFFNSTIEYFSNQAEFMLLLHTWSLSVEEQFYLIWPVVVLSVGYLGRSGKGRMAIVVMGCLILASFLGSMIAVSVAPQAAFYLTPFRLWELGIGGSLAIWMEKRRGEPWPRGALMSNFVYGLAVSVVFATYIVLDSESAFPGPVVAPLVLATAAMLLHGNQPGNRLSRLFETPVLVYVGKISYSLYLVHWVLLAAFRNYAGTIHLSPGEGITLSVVSVLTASFSYHVIEDPIRRGASVRAVWLTSASGAAAIAVAAIGMMALEETRWRVGDALPEYAASREAMLEWRNSCRVDEGRAVGPESGVRRCVFGAPWKSARTRWIIWGDSHAEHMAPLLERVMPAGTSVLIYGRCAPYVDHEVVKRWHRGGAAWSRHCGKARRRMLGWLAENRDEIDRVILAAAWSGYPAELYDKSPGERGETEKGTKLMERAMEATAQEIPGGIPVLVLSDVPRPRRGLVNCVADEGGILLRRRPALCDGLPRDSVDAFQQPTTGVLKRISAKHDNFEMIDLVDRMCSDATCDVFVNGRLLYRDGNHFRMNLTAKEIDTLVERIGLREALKGSPP